MIRTFSYYGGKETKLPWLCGSAVVGLNHPASFVVLNDGDGEQPSVAMTPVARVDTPLDRARHWAATHRLRRMLARSDLSARADATIYCDPPYTRGGGLVDHTLRACKGRVAGWHVDEVAHGPRVECLWRNYAL